MDIEKAVVEFGTQAVIDYRAMAQTRHDNEVPLSVLRCQVASRLHARFACPVHVERLYTVMALDLGVTLTPDLAGVLGGRRADVAMYRDGRPVALVEFTVFDAAAPLPAVGGELHTAKILARFADDLRVFLGVMVCPITVSLEARVERLHDAVGGHLYVGERQLSRDARWHWCFACAAVG